MSKEFYTDSKWEQEQTQRLYKLYPNVIKKIYPFEENKEMQLKGVDALIFDNVLTDFKIYRKWKGYVSIEIKGEYNEGWLYGENFIDRLLCVIDSEEDVGYAFLTGPIKDKYKHLNEMGYFALQEYTKTGQINDLEYREYSKGSMILLTLDLREICKITPVFKIDFKQGSVIDLSGILSKGNKDNHK